MACLEVEHKSTGRCTPFALCHHAALFPNPYAYQRNKVSRACRSLDNTVVDPADNTNRQ